MSDQTAKPRDTLVMEIRPNEWRGDSRFGGFAVPIQRDELGQLNEESTDRVKNALRQCLKGANTSDIKCLCALASGGTSLRSIELPVPKGVPLKNLLELQIEKEWPLSPSDLAWGFQRLAEPKESPDSKESPNTKVAIAAVKRSLFLHYTAILKECGLDAKWTLSACAGSLLEGIESASSCSLLDIRETYSDLVTFENGYPIAVRHLNCGWEALPAQDETIPTEGSDNPEQTSAMQPLIDALNLDETRPPLTIVGTEAWLSKKQASLQGLLPDRRISSHGISDRNGACLATQSFGENLTSAQEALLIELKSAEDAQAPNQTNRKPILRWTALLLLLVVLALLTRRIEPTLRSSSLDAKLKQFNEQKSQLPELDRELSFMEHMAEKSLPYMDLISLLAAQTVPGFQLETLDMGSDRQIQLRGALPQNAQPEDLRAKLLSSGWFERVVLDEQTPDKNKRNLTIRMSLTVKAPLRRPPLSESALGIEPDKTPADAAKKPLK